MTPKAQKRALPVALVIDDDAPFRLRLARALSARGFAVHEAATAQEGLARAQATQPALVTLDLRMPGGSGLDIVAPLAALDCAPCVLLLTGYGSGWGQQGSTTPLVFASGAATAAAVQWVVVQRAVTRDRRRRSSGP